MSCLFISVRVVFFTLQSWKLNKLPFATEQPRSPKPIPKVLHFFPPDSRYLKVPLRTSTCFLSRETPIYLYISNGDFCCGKTHSGEFCFGKKPLVAYKRWKLSGFYGTTEYRNYMMFFLSPASLRPCQKTTRSTADPNQILVPITKWKKDKSKVWGLPKMVVPNNHGFSY